MAVTVNIIDFGAQRDTDTLQTQAIQKAIDHCFLNGGGTVEVPEGTYLTGDIRIRSGVTLHLLKNSCIKGSTKPEDYFNYVNDKVQPLTKDQISGAPFVSHHIIKDDEAVSENSPFMFKRIVGSRWNNALIRAIDAKDIKIIGEENSLIDGSNCYDAQGEENYRGPHGMTFFNCKNIELYGYTAKDTGNWAHNLLYCDNINAEKITVLAGHDGFDVAACNNVRLVNSEFYTGDDCVAGFGNVNTYVADCVLNSSCSAIRFGGTNVLIERCKIYGPGKYCFRGSLSGEEKQSCAPSRTDGGRMNMLSAFTYYADYSMPIYYQPGNIVMSDCTIENADKILHYNYSGTETWQRQKSMADIKFENIKAHDLCMPLMLYGDKDLFVRMEMKNVEISLRNGFENVDLIHAANYDKILLDNVTIKNHTGDAVIRTWSDGDVEFRGTSEKIDEQKRVVAATQDFFCNAI